MRDLAALGWLGHALSLLKHSSNWLWEAKHPHKLLGSCVDGPARLRSHARASQLPADPLTQISLVMHIRLQLEKNFYQKAEF